MKFENQVKIVSESFTKCYAICEQDCSLGQLYDFACHLQAMAVQKIKEFDEAQKANMAKEASESSEEQKEAE